MSIFDTRGGNQQKPSRGAPYIRVNRQVATTTGTAFDIPQNAYVAITVGPRHTCGAVLVQNKSFNGLNYTFGLGGVAPGFSDASILISPRGGYEGYFEGPTRIMMPAANTASFTQALIPEIDLLFWIEPPNQVFQRADLSAQFAALQNAQTLWVPTTSRRTVRLTIANIGGGASATTISLAAYTFVGYQNAATRQYNTPAIAIASGSSYMVTFSDMNMTPVTPLQGENGIVPGAIIVAEAGATAILVVYVEALD
jgi:hypothetical protein